MNSTFQAAPMFTFCFYVRMLILPCSQTISIRKNRLDVLINFKTRIVHMNPSKGRTLVFCVNYYFNADKKFTIP